MENQLASALHTGIKALYKDGCLTDVVIRVGNQTFPCHKLVLSSLSPYFMTMFTSDFKDKQQEEVLLESTGPETFECILKYIYCSGEHVINDDNVQDIFIASCMFLLSQIKHKCISYIGDRLNSENVFKTWKLAKSF